MHDRSNQIQLFLQGKKLRIANSNTHKQTDKIKLTQHDT